MSISRVFKYTICTGLMVYFLYFILFIQLNINSHASDDTKTSIVQRIKVVTNCTDNVSRYEFSKRGNFCVLYNYVISSRRFKCEESVTYVTHSDYTMLDNLIPVLNRWVGPISVALHAPGSDFKSALESVLYLRNCVPLMKEYVTFHIYFPNGHIPKEIPSQKEVMEATYNCSLDAPYEGVNQSSTHVARNKLIYPINLARNVARSMAETHYVLTSDIELYPSPDFIPRFLEMISESDLLLSKHYPAVFPLAVFEIELGTAIPNNKTELQSLLKKKLAIPFHQNRCSLCHEIPKQKEWIEKEEGQKIYVLHAASRTGKYQFWEPFYIGTKAEPIFDERLSWEGMQDKMIQAYTMCLLNYSFLVLDNAFLVHRPGIKKTTSTSGRNHQMMKTQYLLHDVIVPELQRLYKNRTECRI